MVTAAIPQNAQWHPARRYTPSMRARSEPSDTPSRVPGRSLAVRPAMKRSAVAPIIVLHACLAVTTFAQDEEPKLNQPTRPGTARSAEIQQAGVLQIEIRLEARLHSPEIHS